MRQMNVRASPLALAGLLILPWLWPLTTGPVAAVEPYLVSAAAAGLALALWPTLKPGHAERAVAGAWIAAALISSGAALLQYFDLEAPLHPWINMAEPGQAFGNLRQPNQLATLLVIGLWSLRWLYSTSGASAGKGGALYAGGAGLVLTALAATASRAGLAELFAVAVLSLVWARPWAEEGGRRTWVLTGLLVLVYACAAVALPVLLQGAEGLSGRNMLDRLQHAESTCGSRLILWRNVLHLIALKPWAGWGWGELAYAHYITLYDGARFCHILDNAHNLPLHLAVELGVPVALLVCAGLCWLIWRGRPWAEQNPTRQLAWGVLMVIGIHSLVEYPLWYGPFQIAVALCVWMLWATRDGGARAPVAASDGAVAGADATATAPARAQPGTSGLSAWGGPRPALLRLLLAAALLAAVAYAAWDYHRVSQVYLPFEQRAAAYRSDTMAHARRSWLYAGVVRFADVTSRPATRENAAWMLPEAQQALHFSPEPRVITRVIESASWLDHDALALAHLARLRAAFPQEYREWVAENAEVLSGAERQSGGRAAASAASK